jgi:hypothetical protein
MSYIFSATDNAFYPLSMRQQYADAGTWPENGIQVSDDIFNEFTATPEPGKMRIAGSDGLPAWSDIPPPSHEELIAIAEQVSQQLLTQADAVMLDWRTELMLGEISDANRAKLSAWIAYKNEVKAVDVTSAPEHISWPVPPEA